MGLRNPRSISFSLIALVAAIILHAVASAIVAGLAANDAGTDVLAAMSLPTSDWVRYIAAILIMLGMCRFLLIAARKNYERHIAKIASLLVAFLQPSNEGIAVNKHEDIVIVR